MSDAANITDLFPECQPIDRAAETLETRCAWSDIAGKMAVYLLSTTDAGGIETPVLLATVGDLRAALKRRLADDAPDLRTKRVHYGKLCDRLRFRVVCSPFAANLAYVQAARMLFPLTYKKMIAQRRTWWIAFDAAAKFPQFERTQYLEDAASVYAGPVRDKTAAGKLIETAQDLFDLCRYQNILVQVPLGKACAYKEMGKCPAPCDGSVGMDWYHAAMKGAFGWMTGETRGHWWAAQEGAMREAAGHQQYEKAGRIKQRLQRAVLVESTTSDSYHHLARLEDFSFLVMQPGKGKQWAEPFIVHGGRVDACEPLSNKALAEGAEKLLQRCREVAGVPVKPPLDEAAVERLSVVAHHLFKGEDDWGVFMRLRDVARVEKIAEMVEEMMRRSGRAKPMAEQSSEAKAELKVTPLESA